MSVVEKIKQKIKDWWNKPRYEGVIECPTPEGPEPPTPQPRTQVERNFQEEITKIQEEQVRKQFLPESPKVHRRPVHNTPPPAERHRQAISKFMKGKGRQSKHYRQTIKRSKNIKIEEDD